MSNASIVNNCILLLSTGLTLENTQMTEKVIDNDIKHQLKQAGYTIYFIYTVDI